MKVHGNNSYMLCRKTNILKFKLTLYSHLFKINRSLTNAINDNFRIFYIKETLQGATSQEYCFFIFFRYFLFHDHGIELCKYVKISSFTRRINKIYFFRTETLLLIVIQNAFETNKFEI